ncbi:hypothetical protein [Mobiluncus mulieris]|nr:hypothetical protein [Mobiluncus mulieris]
MVLSMPNPTIHGQTPGRNASSPGQAPHESGGTRRNKAKETIRYT